MKMNVLVFPSNSQPAIDINFALRHALRVEVHGASSIDDHGKYVFKNYIPNLPKIDEDDFVSELNKVLKQFNIHFIIPTHDTVALFLKENEDKIMAKIICSSIETTRICRYKSLTYSRLAGHPFVPEIFIDREHVKKFPVFLKPDDGQGGKGTSIVHNETELDYHLSKNTNLLMCEYLPGEEITVDCFTDRNGTLRYICPRTRERLLAGISVPQRKLEYHGTFLVILHLYDPLS